MNNNLTLGMDIGIGSTGWAVTDQEKARLVDFGERIFETATEASEPRQHRSARRTIRRNKWRREQMKAAFLERGLVTEEDLNDPNYLSFTADNNKYNRPDVDTIYHLRKKALKEKVSMRELLMCLYNICKTRGHFLLEDIDFNTERVSYDVFKERFYDYTSGIILFDDDRILFEEKLLRPLFNSELKTKKDITQLFKNYSFTNDQDNDAALLELALLLRGYKGDLNKINDAYDSKSLYVMDLKKKTDDLTEFEERIIELSDLINISKILSDGSNYLCEVAVTNLEDFKRAFLAGKNDPEKYAEYLKDIQKKNSSTKHLRAVKNLDNNYPNGLYVKEAVDILRCQSNFYPLIDDSFIEICSSIISARIPYYIGPLSEKGKNAWVKKKGTFKYSYDYSIKHFDSVDVYESIREWKKRMVSHCTYLPQYEAMPKGSFVAETYSILNEINSLDRSTRDCNGQAYYLSKEDKLRILDDLFLGKEGDVSFKDVEELLNLENFGSRNRSIKKFNNKYTLSKAIFRIIPDLRVNTVLEIFNNTSKIDELERLILDINLFDEESSKKDYFEKEEKYSQFAKALSKLKSSSFYNLSREFILNTKVDDEGNSIMDKLFDDNCEEYTNNLMYIINNAFDENGEKIDFISNKYHKLLRENGGVLDVNLLLQEGKPVIPVSRPTVRALNEAFKVYQAVIETYGVPKRIVIETASGKDSIKDHTVIDERGEKRFIKNESLYNHLVEQIKKSRIDDFFFNGVHVEDLDEIKSFAGNKDKLELYIRQNGIDLITGKVIDFTHFEDYEIDHILPRGFQDDSMNDKMLISKLANAKKSNRLPIEFLESPDAREVTTMTVSRFERIVNGLSDMELISENKRKRLLMKSSSDVEQFVNQNLVDTRYIISEFMSAINAYNELKGYEAKVVALRGAFTDTFRKAFNFKKERSLGDQHHAIDAAVLCVADACLSAYFSNYDSRGNFRGYENFIKDIVRSERDNKDIVEERDKNRNTIIHAYYKAYGQKYSSSDSLIGQIKNTVPLYSHKVEKNWRGALTKKSTLYEPLGDNDKSPLSIIGMNNSKRSFTDVNCVAVDFYKIKKGKNAVHVAIHIPYAIVDSRGCINEKKYLDLIKDYYKVPELIDDGGNLKEYLFRFRAFKNDIIYDTHSNVPQLFNIGSIALKKLELKQILNFSYNSIYDQAFEIARMLAKRFLIKFGKYGEIAFEETNKAELIDYINENLFEINNFKSFESKLKERLKGEKDLISFARKYVYLATIANRGNVPPTIDGQYMPTANNNDIKKDRDAEYVKLKYGVLGLRFGKSSKGKLIINSAHGTCGKYKKIKKEQFNWTISKLVVQ